MRILLAILLLVSSFFVSSSTNQSRVFSSKLLVKEDIIKIGPPNYQVYDYLKIYSEKYGVPFEYALKCAYQETLYRGKYDFRYRPFIDKWRVSYKEAYGVMQVQIPTANDYWEREITAEDLGYNIKINVISSMRYLHDLYYNVASTRGDWKKVYSVYNQGWKGSKQINQYAINVVGE